MLHDVGNAVRERFCLFRSLLVPNQVIFLEDNARHDALKSMSSCVPLDLLALEDRASFDRLVLERERVMSTGIGQGVAIPHGKMTSLEHFFLVIGIHPRGIFWDSIDRGLVHFIFLIGGPDNQQRHYLQLLSELTYIVNRPSCLERLLHAKSQEEVISILQYFLDRYSDSEK